MQGNTYRTQIISCSRIFKHNSIRNSNNNLNVSDEEPFHMSIDEKSQSETLSNLGEKNNE